MSAEETAAKIISKVGLWWPLAEEDQLRTAAGGYEACAGSLRTAAVIGQAGANLVTGGNTGKAFTAFDDHWDQYHAGLPATAKACDQVAAALREFADKVDEAKKKIINLAIEIGATIAVGAGLAFFTFGTSAGAAAARTAMLVARGVTIAMGLTGVASTIVATMLVGAAFGAVEGFISGIVAQVGKQVLNDGPGITLGETMAWTGIGAGAGVATAGLGLAFRGAATALKNGDNAFLTRLRNVNWGDETGSISFGGGLGNAGRGPMAKGLIGVPEEPLNRMVSRIRGLNMGGKPIVTELEAFGSRAGSTFRRPTGPLPASDLDVIVTVRPGYLSGRQGPWVRKTLRQIATDFEEASGIQLHLRVPENVSKFKGGIGDTEYKSLPIP